LSDSEGTSRVPPHRSRPVYSPPASTPSHLTPAVYPDCHTFIHITIPHCTR
jgi:hypothetical protein